MDERPPCRKCGNHSEHLPNCEYILDFGYHILSRHRDYPPLPSIGVILTAGSPTWRKMLDIHIAPFVRRQTQESQYSHWILSDDDLTNRIADAFADGHQGYRDGVFIVPVNPRGFYTSIVTLENGDRLVGQFRPRSPKEEPRKSVVMDRGDRPLAELKQPATKVDIILYHDDVLAEDGDQTGHKWNIISVNAYPTEEEAPIHPDVLIANHFHLSGGTKTNMTPVEFEAQLRVSVMYWKDKAMVR